MACDMNHIIEFSSIKQDIFKMVGDMVKGIRQKPEEKDSTDYLYLILNLIARGLE